MDLDRNYRKRSHDFDFDFPNPKHCRKDPDALFALANLPPPLLAMAASHGPKPPSWWLQQVQHYRQQHPAPHPRPGAASSLSLKQASILEYLRNPHFGQSTCMDTDASGPQQCLCGAAPSTACSYCGHVVCGTCVASCARCGELFCGVCSQVYYGHRLTEHYCLNCIQLVPAK